MSDTATPSTPKAKPTTGVGALSDREAEILAKAWSCLKSGPPEIDYPKLAAEVGMSNHRSAQNAWAAIKKKMQWNLTATPASVSKAAGTPASTKRKKAGTPAKGSKTAEDNDDDAADNDTDELAADPEATPSKKAKTNGRAKAAGDGTPKTPRKKAATPRKPKAPAKVKDEAFDEEMKGSEDDKNGIADEGKFVKAEADDEKKPVKDEADGDEADGDEPVKAEAMDEAMDEV